MLFRSSSIPYWISGLSTSGSISFGMALVAGRNRVPSPAAGKTALRTFGIMLIIVCKTLPRSHADLKGFRGRIGCMDGDAKSTLAREFFDRACQLQSQGDLEMAVDLYRRSIELAPLLRLSDAVLAVVESGKTLEENDLSVLETVHPVTARLIANRSSHMFKEELIREMVAKLREVVK